MAFLWVSSLVIPAPNFTYSWQTAPGDKEVLPGSRINISNVLPHLMYQKQQVLKETDFTGVPAYQYTISSFSWTKRITMSPNLHYNWLLQDIARFPKDTPLFTRCKVTLRTVSQLVSGELTPDVRSCFLYSNYVLEIVLCKISADYKCTKFWDSLHYTSGRIKRLPDLILL